MGEPLPIQTSVPMCFGCGTDNPSGLHLRFEREDDATVLTRLTVPVAWTGWGDMVHGGLLALLLDEVTAWAAWGLLGERTFVTKEMTIRFRRPARIDRPLVIRGRIAANEAKRIVVRGEIRDESGRLVCESDGVLVRVPPERLEPLRKG